MVVGSFTNKNMISGPVHATKQFQKNRFFLTVVLFWIVLASFTNKNMIPRPLHATKQFQQKSVFVSLSCCF